MIVRIKKISDLIFMLGQINRKLKECALSKMLLCKKIFVKVKTALKKVLLVR